MLERCYPCCLCTKEGIDSKKVPTTEKYINLLQPYLERLLTLCKYLLTIFSQFREHLRKDPEMWNNSINNAIQPFHPTSSDVHIWRDLRSPTCSGISTPWRADHYLHFIQDPWAPKLPVPYPEAFIGFKLKSNSDFPYLPIAHLHLWSLISNQQ